MDDFWTNINELFQRVLALFNRQAPLITLAVLIFIAGLYIAAVAKSLVRRGMQRRRVDP